MCRRHPRSLAATLATIAATGLAAIGPAASGLAGSAADAGPATTPTATTPTAPTPPGPVTGLHVDAVTRPAGFYEVTTSWQAGPDTSAYRVRVTDAEGVVLDRGTVTAASWQAEVEAVAGARVRVTVTPYHDTTRGTPSRLPVVLPDLTPPVGTFRLDRVRRVATLTRTALSDDVSRRADIRTSVVWGDGSPRQRWTSGASIDHRFPGPGIWHPRVRLVDTAGNAAVVAVGVVTIGDRTSPTGTFSASPTASWASWTEVGLTALALHDDLSAADAIARTVAWGDGTRTPWPAGSTAAHVYATEGTFTPEVRLVDEAGNRALVAANQVVVTRDAAPPSVRLWLPDAHRDSARRWRVLEGRARDGQTGVGLVRVKAVQRRATGWFGYRPVGGRWVAAHTEREAWHKARASLVLPAASGAWLCTVRPLPTGLLVYKVTARDYVGNTSAPVVHRQLLTSP